MLMWGLAEGQHLECYYLAGRHVGLSGPTLCLLGGAGALGSAA